MRGRGEWRDAARVTRRTEEASRQVGGGAAAIQVRQRRAHTSVWDDGGERDEMKINRRNIKWRIGGRRRNWRDEMNGSVD
jgi:hypothetical protein